MLTLAEAGFSGRMHCAIDRADLRRATDLFSFVTVSTRGVYIKDLKKLKKVRDNFPKIRHYVHSSLIVDCS